MLQPIRGCVTNSSIRTAHHSPMYDIHTSTVAKCVSVERAWMSDHDSFAQVPSMLLLDFIQLNILPFFPECHTVYFTSGAKTLCMLDDIIRMCDAIANAAACVSGKCGRTTEPLNVRNMIERGMNGSSANDQSTLIAKPNGWRGRIHPHQVIYSTFVCVCQPDYFISFRIHMVYITCVFQL